MARGRKPNNPHDPKQLINDRDFSALIRRIGENGDNLKTLIQQGAYQALLYAYSNDNYDRATTLYYAVEVSLSSGQAIRLRRWFETFGPFGWRDTKDGKKFRKSKAEDAPQFNLELAYNTNWWEAMEGEGEGEEGANTNTQRLFSITKVTNRLERLVTDLTKALEEHKLEHGDEEEELKELLEELATVLARHKVEETEKGLAQAAAA